MIRLKLHTGPTQVDAVADRLEGLSGICVTVRGTEHVYATVDTMSIDEARDRLATASGLPFLRHAIVAWAHETEASR